MKANSERLAEHTLPQTGCFIAAPAWTGIGPRRRGRNRYRPLDQGEVAALVPFIAPGILAAIRFHPGLRREHRRAGPIRLIQPRFNRSRGDAP